MSVYAVIGGGIAGVSCVESLAFSASEGSTIYLISSSDTIKGIKNLVKYSDHIESFEVYERFASIVIEII